MTTETLHLFQQNLVSLSFVMDKLGIETFGFDDKTIAKPPFHERFRLKKGEVARCGIVVKEDMSTAVQSAFVHFHNGFFLCKHGFCCEKLGGSKRRFGVALVRYDLAKVEGKLTLKGRKIYPWIFGKSLYLMLVQLHKEWSLQNHDIKIQCDVEEFQRMTFTPYAESLWTSNEILKANILAEYDEIHQVISQSFGKNLTEAQIKDRLSEDNAPLSGALTKKSYDDPPKPWQAKKVWAPNGQADDLLDKALDALNDPKLTMNPVQAATVSQINDDTGDEAFFKSLLKPDDDSTDKGDKAFFKSLGAGNFDDVPEDPPAQSVDVKAIMKEIQQKVFKELPLRKIRWKEGDIKP